MIKYVGASGPGSSRPVINSSKDSVGTFDTNHQYRQTVQFRQNDCCVESRWLDVRQLIPPRCRERQAPFRAANELEETPGADET